MNDVIERNAELNDLDLSKVGEDATINYYTDRQACTIIKRTEKKIWVQRDKATLLNGLKSGAADALEFAPGGFCGHTSGKQRYQYEQDKEGSVKCFSRREFEVYDANKNKMCKRVKYFEKTRAVLSAAKGDA